MRFSNGSLGPNAPDILPNVRGVAFKIYKICKTNVLAEEQIEGGRESECDFLMVNSPTFFVRDIGFIEAIMEKNVAKILSYLPSLVSTLVPAVSQLVPSLLKANYYTQVPHWFGDRLCKYALIARRTVTSSANYLDLDYLRHGLEHDLQTSTASFDFCVQFKQSKESGDILTQKWNGPMLTLATLEINSHQSNILESNGEELSFNPFRTPTNHQPAGWVGRMRKAVYKADFEWRQEKKSLAVNIIINCRNLRDGHLRHIC